MRARASALCVFAMIAMGCSNSSTSPDTTEAAPECDSATPILAVAGTSTSNEQWGRATCGSTSPVLVTETTMYLLAVAALAARVPGRPAELVVRPARITLV